MQSSPFERSGRRFRFIVTLAMAAVIAACDSAIASPVLPTAGGSEPASASSSVANSIVDQTNAERSRAGLPALRANVKLMRAAQIQADQMAQSGQMAHVLPGAAYPEPADRLAAVSYSWRTYGENVAWNQRDASAVMASWMNSSGHRANILGENFTEIGVAVAYDNGGHPYYVQVFGRPL